MNGLKRAAVALAAVAFAAVPAHSQVISYTASGAFTGTGCTALSCSQDGFTLSYTAPSGTQNVTSGLAGSLGSFFTESNGTSSNTTFSGVGFTLTIDQSNPLAPNTPFNGTIAGLLSMTGTGLVFTPSSPVLQIGSVSYALKNLQNGGFTIGSPTVANASVESPLLATITTPEPSSIVLLTSGLIGLVPMARRRRRSA